VRPIVLLHGFTGSPCSWLPVVSQLQAPLVLAPALVGHDGRRDAENVQCFEDELDRLAEIVRAVRQGPAHVAGYSLGARLALGLVLSHPELFSSATLIGVQPGLRLPIERAARQLIDQAWCELIEREGVAAFVSAWEVEPIFHGQTPAQRLAQRAIRCSHTPSGLIRALRTTGLGVMPCLIDRLREARIPIQLLVGERDRKFRTLAESLIPMLQRPSLEIVSGAGHNLLVERPELIARAIARGALPCHESTGYSSPVSKT
jgi:2-succinyl-6-hydroxy-2,4-cyclohexadiene-1-carboxylate synthase